MTFAHWPARPCCTTVINMQAAARRRRSGWSLLELMVMIAVTGIVMSTIAITMGLAFKNDQNSRESMRLSGIHFQLGQRFRRDVHRALSAEAINSSADGKTEGMTLLLHGATRVEYRHELDRVVCLRQRDGKTIQYDTYAIASGSSVQWSITQDAVNTLATVTIKPPVAANARRLVVPAVCIQATIGLVRVPQIGDLK